MTSAVWMIELGRTSWRLHVRRDDHAAQIAAQEFAANELVSQAESIQSALLDNGYAGEAAVLALESEWCLTATIPVDRPSELRDERTMAFRFEEWIPWGAEDFVSDFREAGKQALAIAAPTEPLAQFLGRLAELDVSLESIVPWPILLAAEQVARGVGPGVQALAFERRGWIDLIVVDNSMVTAWKWLPASAVVLRRELDCLALETGTRPSLCGYELNGTLLAELHEHAAVDPIDTSTAAGVSTTELALSAAARLLQGMLEAPVELKRGSFGRNRGHVALRRYALVLQAAVAVLLLTGGAALIYRGYTAGRNAQQLTAQQSEAFRSVFPTTKVPVGVVSRLKSELAKLKGLHGDDGALPDSMSVTVVLHRLLSALPTDRRFRLLEIRIEEGRLYLDGEVRGHSDAEAIAQRLRGEGFEVSPPKTQRLDGERVTLRITGVLTPASKQLAQNSP